MKQYLCKMPRKAASTIFQTRSRMLKVKSNYKNKYKSNLTCRACGLSEETQDHVLQECPKIHLNETNKVKPEHIFTENETQLLQTAHRIHTNITLLETYSKPSRVLTQSNGSAPTPTQSGGMGPPPAQSERAPQRPGRTAPQLN